MATRENKIKTDMQALGIYQPAFDPAIHQLCVLERELSRAMKAWKTTAKDGEAPSAANPLYDAILKQRKAILEMQDALGLTPRALKKLKRGSGEGGEDDPNSMSSKLNALLTHCQSYDATGKGGTP